MSPRLLLILGALLSCLAQTGCEESSSEPRQTATASTWLPLAVGGVPIEAQIVLTAPEQSKGLMHRQSLGEDRGMLFPYETPQPMAFWMKNTLIPLDIGYFDEEGVLREIHALYPRDTRTVASRRDNLSYALEMNQGWFARNNIKPGAKLDRELLAAALSARGANPADFGLSEE